MSPPPTRTDELVLKTAAALSRLIDKGRPGALLAGAVCLSDIDDLSNAARATLTAEITKLRDALDWYRWRVQKPADRKRTKPRGQR
jgi:hypothetical protein